jgi:hypothetical protein
MKKFTAEELPDAVETLYGKVQFIERLLKKKNRVYKHNKRSKNYLVGEKCGSNFNKSDLAQFFYILMDESILFFDHKNEKRNRSKMQQFVEGNFTYTGDLGLQVGIDTISRQFSESKGFTYREKQLNFLDKIIEILQKRRGIVAAR